MEILEVIAFFVGLIWLAIIFPTVRLALWIFIGVLFALGTIIAAATVISQASTDALVGWGLFVIVMGVMLWVTWVVQIRPAVIRDLQRREQQ